MERRDFLKIAGIGTAGAVLSASSAYSFKKKGKLTAKDIHNHLRSLVEVNEPSVDRFIIGNPEAEVKKIGTAWMPYWKTLKEAKSADVNLMIVHEPTFYTHWDLDAHKWDYYDAPSPARENYFEQRDKKKKWIEENEMVIIRCHDVLDKIADWGIPYAFGQGLGFSNDQIIRSKTFYNIYSVESQPANVIAKHIAVKLKAIGQPGVSFYGDENFMVKTVGLGTGCICDPLEYSELNPDMFIGIDDTIRTWVQTTYAEDTGKPLIVVNHGTSEEFGVRSLNNHLKSVFKNHEVIHFPEGCSYRWITA